MAISALIFNDFNKYLNECNSILELGNQLFTNECLSKYDTFLNGFTNTTPVKKYCENLNKQHVSIDITGYDESLPIDLNNEIISISDQFDLITNFGTTEHIEPNQYEPFLHIHNLCKIGGVMIHEIPVVNHWIGHCRYYYDERFFEKLAKDNNYLILEMKRVSYPNDGDLIFVAMQKTSEKFNSQKEDLEKFIFKTDVAVNIPEYWKNIL